MPHMPKHHTKGPHLGKMDERYSDPARKAQLLRALRDPSISIADVGTLAAAPNTFEEEADVRAGTLTQSAVIDARKRHLREHWFGEGTTFSGPLKPWDGTGWWRNWKGKPAETFRCGLIRALEVSMALGHNCPYHPSTVIQAQVGKQTGEKTVLVNEPPAIGSRARDLPIDFHWICGPSRFEMYINWNEQQVTVIIVTPGFPVSIEEFAPDDAAELDDWVASAQGTIFVGQNEKTNDQNYWVATMEDGVITHHLDVSRGGSGTWR